MTSWFRRGTSRTDRPLLVRSLCLCGALLLGPPPVRADAGAELLERLAALGHLAADFTQAQYGPGGKLLEQATGHVRLLRPKFRWEVASPYPQIIVADGDELSVYDPDLEQVVVRPIDEALGGYALGAAHQLHLGPERGLSGQPAGRGRVQLAAKIRRRPDRGGGLGLWRNQLRELIIRDSLGHRTDIAFNRFQDASVIESADFNLDLPPGVEFHQGR